RQTTDEHFAKAVGIDAESAAQNAAQSDTVTPRNEHVAKNEPVAITENYDGLRYCTGVQVGVTELESVTSCMSSKRSNQLSYTPAGSFRPSALGLQSESIDRVDGRLKPVLYDSRRWLRRQGSSVGAANSRELRALTCANLSDYQPCC